MYEGDRAESPLVGSDGNAPPPPPKTRSMKDNLNVQGGKHMIVACYAEDVREPDFIGDTKVDLTEVLTKGETDREFGRVYSHFILFILEQRMVHVDE